MSEGFVLRICYCIGPRLAYLSHLETIRSVERIIRRAQLPFAITEGFNPHMKIAFGPALPVGCGSEGEYVDVRLRDFMAPDEALARLQAAAPPELMPAGCEYIGIRDDAITVAFPISDWEARLIAPARQPGAGALDALQAALDALLARGYIEVTKKKGRKTVTKQVAFEGRLIGMPVLSCEDSALALRFTTLQGNEGALRPDKFVEALLELAGDDAPRLASLTRLRLHA